MKKLFNKLFLFFPCLLLSSCNFNSNINGEMLLQFGAKLVKEYEGKNEISEENKWFKSKSNLTVIKNETYTLQLNYNNGAIKTFEGSYKLYVKKPGSSGDGWFILDNEKIKLTFLNSYFLIFDLPTKFNPEGKSEVRTLHFQYWWNI